MFTNRKKPIGWLTPTAEQLVRTHENLVDLICKILPITKLVLEVNRFAFMELDDPNIQKWQYQKGPLYQTDGLHDAVFIQQDGHCLLCRKEPIDVYHHIVPRNRNGSNTIANIAGLCEDCHELVHTDEKYQKKLTKKKVGCNKKYHALSVLNQIFPELIQRLNIKFPGQMYVTNGYSTKAFRDANHIPKNHDLDAYCIACSILENQTVVCPDVFSYEIKQFRNHDRSNIHHQTERTYYLEKKKVAVNHKKRFEQKGNSLKEWFQEMIEQHGRKKAEWMRSNLQVKRSLRYYNDRTRILPGAMFYRNGQRYVIAGQHCKGSYLRAYGYGNQDFPVKQCSVYAHTGLVYV